MKNRIGDVHDHVLAALERLNDESLTPEQVQAEAVRGKAIANLAGKSVEIGRLALDACELSGATALPPMLENANGGAAPRARR